VPFLSFPAYLKDLSTRSSPLVLPLWKSVLNFIRSRAHREEARRKRSSFACLLGFVFPPVPGYIFSAYLFSTSAVLPTHSSEATFFFPLLLVCMRSTLTVASIVHGRSSCSEEEPFLKIDTGSPCSLLSVLRGRLPFLASRLAPLGSAWSSDIERAAGFRGFSPCVEEVPFETCIFPTPVWQGGSDLRRIFSPLYPSPEDDLNRGTGLPPSFKVWKLRPPLPRPNPPFLESTQRPDSAEARYFTDFFDQITFRLFPNDRPQRGSGS